MSASKVSIIAKYTDSLTESDRQLAWIIGKLQSHSSSNQKLVCWDEVLERVDFNLQKIIVRARRNRDFERNWLRRLVDRSKRRPFRELKEKAEAYCRRKLQSSGGIAAPEGSARDATLSRWSSASPATIRYLFSHSPAFKPRALSTTKRVRKDCVAKSDADTCAMPVPQVCDKRSRKTPRRLKLTIVIDGVKEDKRIIFPSCSAEPSTEAIGGPTLAGRIDEDLSQDDHSQSISSYVSTLRVYRMFSSTMRREAHLLLHLSQWKSWHLTNHTNGAMFAKTQESVFNAFRDDELHLSKLALNRACGHIACDNKAILDMAKNYAALREKTFNWWCSMTYKSCLEFATTQNLRSWEDFEFTQRSLWENLMQLENAICDFHFQECMSSSLASRANDEANGIKASVPRLLPSVPPLVLHAGAGHYLHHYVTCLKNYLHLNVSSRKQAFIHAYLARWKTSWVEVWGAQVKRISFLEEEKAHLDRFICAENASFNLAFRGPGEIGFGCAFGCSKFLRELSHFTALRANLWYLFCHDIVLERWNEFLGMEIPNYNDFEKSQLILWDYFDTMEQAILKVHGMRCTQLAGVGWAPPSVPLPVLVA
jgi:hypothetical protein